MRDLEIKLMRQLRRRKNTKKRSSWLKEMQNNSRMNSNNSSNLSQRSKVRILTKLLNYNSNLIRLRTGFSSWKKVKSTSKDTRNNNSLPISTIKKRITCTNHMISIMKSRLISSETTMTTQPDDQDTDSLLFSNIIFIEFILYI